MGKNAFHNDSGIKYFPRIFHTVSPHETDSAGPSETSSPQAYWRFPRFGPNPGGYPNSPPYERSGKMGPVQSDRNDLAESLLIERIGGRVLEASNTSLAPCRKRIRSARKPGPSCHQGCFFQEQSPPILYGPKDWLSPIRCNRHRRYSLSLAWVILPFSADSPFGSESKPPVRSNTWAWRHPRQ